MYGMSLSLSDYLQAELRRRGWSRRTLAMYADISADTAARAVRGDSVPDTETIRKIAAALQVDEVYLLRLAGHVEETPQGLSDPSIIDLAQRLEGLSPEERERVLRAINATMEAVVPREGTKKARAEREATAGEKVQKALGTDDAEYARDVIERKQQEEAEAGGQ